eukprot:TRINITY_DN9925_c0_g1_i3.p1 TRINITY_DN9925_c0_g1~~TRINITY_DN9925_c0_g1_i3.p1  ORF type:complete len:450 (+),score=193.06 TRINITY_DN9925_c0_g1_i3:48-1397(+)
MLRLNLKFLTLLLVAVAVALASNDDLTDSDTNQPALDVHDSFDSDTHRWREMAPNEGIPMGAEARLDKASGKVMYRPVPNTKEDKAKIKAQMTEAMDAAKRQAHRAPFEFDMHVSAVRAKHGDHVGRHVPAEPEAKPGAKPEAKPEANPEAKPAEPHGLADHLRAVLVHFREPPQRAPDAPHGDPGTHPRTTHHLEEVEALVHDTAHARDLVRLHGHEDMVRLLLLPSGGDAVHEIHQGALRVLLAATRNNPKATDAFLAADAMATVIALLGHERTKALCLAAAAALMDHHRDVQEQFIKAGGPNIALRALIEHGPPKTSPDFASTLDVKRRVLVLALAHLVDDPTSALSAHMVAPGWCRRVPALTVRSELFIGDADLAEKLLDTLAAMAASSPTCAAEAAEFEHRHGGLMDLKTRWAKSDEDSFERDLMAKAAALIETLRRVRDSDTD